MSIESACRLIFPLTCSAELLLESIAIPQVVNLMLAFPLIERASLAVGSRDVMQFVSEDCIKAAVPIALMLDVDAPTNRISQVFTVL
jgi:hypothetical protein